VRLGQGRRPSCRDGARGLALAAASVVLALLDIGCSTPKTTTPAEVLLNERMAAVLLSDGQAREAEQAYREAVHNDPKNPEVYDGLGVSLMMQRKFSECLDPFDHAIKLSPEKALYRIHRGMALTELGRYAEAEEDFRAAEASPLPEDRFDVNINRGRMLQREGDFSGAALQFTAALSRNPQSFSARIGRGVARESEGDFPGAAEDYLEAVRLDPKSADANLRLGLVLMTLKKNALGRRYLERAIELDPGGESGSKARLVLESAPSS
jgi:Tfp pilus assembly protein PilF